MDEFKPDDIPGKFARDWLDSPFLANPRVALARTLNVACKAELVVPKQRERILQRAIRNILSSQVERTHGKETKEVREDLVERLTELFVDGAEKQLESEKPHAGNS